MPYQDLYYAHALSGALFQTISIRKAALLIALDNDLRDQSEVEAELPNGGDYAVWMTTDLEPSGKLKAARDRYERALLKSLDSGRLNGEVIARNVDDVIDPVYTRVSVHAVREWCSERDVDTGDWLAQHEESEMEFSDETIQTIANYYLPGATEPDAYDAAAFQTYKSSAEGERADQYLRLLQEIQRLRTESRSPRNTEIEPSINTKEKNSLLTVIAALVAAMGDRLPDGYNQAVAIAGLTDQLGASVSINTVVKILKQTADAVDRRRSA
ncbi:TPA: hypothetical protein ACYLK9_001023 [Burkholderia cenocepacia]